jgi:hypothetical protein
MFKTFERTKGVAPTSSGRFAFNVGPVAAVFGMVEKLLRLFGPNDDKEFYF